MSRSISRHLPLLLFGLLVILALYLLRFGTPPARPPSLTEHETPEPRPSPLSLLAQAPDWSQLEAYQHTITRAEFERLLTEIFTTGEGWKDSIEIQEHEAIIRTGREEPEELFVLRFSSPERRQPVPRLWKPTAELPAAPATQPLAGLHIAIDPGHIGGAWARMEQRWFIYNHGSPVCEGDMTLLVAELLKPRLEALGAQVSLVRERAEPVTALRPSLLYETARHSAAPGASAAARLRLADQLFYRTAEIRARARQVNEVIRPDLVLCLHFNAEDWGNPEHPQLVDRSHFHLLLNGAYNNEEVALADQRFALLRKLLQRTHEEEALVGASMAEAFAEITQLPPFLYPPHSPNARAVNGNPYLWARNLLANRLYDCPVLFLEPYVMNATIDYERIQAGDYEGLLPVAGELRPSLFREYADAVTEGLRRHYAVRQAPLQEH